MISSSDQYLQVMQVVRRRFDAIASIKKSNPNDFFQAEGAAFHGRKIIEGISFGILIAVENGLKAIPNEAKKQYSAERILAILEKKNILAFPSPSIIRIATPEEVKNNDTKITIEGVPANRITPQGLKQIYIRLHNWLHELNPYSKGGHDSFAKNNSNQLWNDLEKVEKLVSRHTVGIGKELFFCVLWDQNDRETKLVSLTKHSNEAIS